MMATESHRREEILSIMQAVAVAAVATSAIAESKAVISPNRKT
ncbi:MAG: hypothetical protein HW402_17 [Dehalococcoidales bacterium]|nr:hypothetical protein [Dehalococcoidales bacterium]